MFNRNCGLRAIKLFIVICFVLVSSMAYGDVKDTVSIGIDCEYGTIEISRTNVGGLLGEIYSCGYYSGGRGVKDAITGSYYKDLFIFDKIRENEYVYDPLRSYGHASMSIAGIHYQSVQDVIIDGGVNVPDKTTFDELIVMAFTINHSDAKDGIILISSKNPESRADTLASLSKSTVYQTTVSCEDYDPVTDYTEAYLYSNTNTDEIHATLAYRDVVPSITIRNPDGSVHDSIVLGYFVHDRALGIKYELSERDFIDIVNNNKLGITNKIIAIIQMPGTHGSGLLIGTEDPNVAISIVMLSRVFPESMSTGFVSGTIEFK